MYLDSQGNNIPIVKSTLVVSDKMSHYKTSHYTLLLTLLTLIFTLKSTYFKWYFHVGKKCFSEHNSTLIFHFLEQNFLLVIGEKLKFYHNFVREWMCRLIALIV